MPTMVLLISKPFLIAIMQGLEVVLNIRGKGGEVSMGEEKGGVYGRREGRCAWETRGREERRQEVTHNDGRR